MPIINFDYNPLASYNVPKEDLELIEAIEDDEIREIFAAAVGDWTGDPGSEDWDRFTCYELLKGLSEEKIDLYSKEYIKFVKLPESIIRLLKTHNGFDMETDGTASWSFLESKVGKGFVNYLTLNLAESIFKDNFSFSESETETDSNMQYLRNFKPDTSKVPIPIISFDYSPVASCNIHKDVLIRLIIDSNLYRLLHIIENVVIDY